MKQLTTNKCQQCGSPLILVNRVTETLEGSKFPQTTTVYRCSNKECQEEIDKQTTKRLKLLKEKEVADQQKLDAKTEEKRLHAAMTLEKL